jgi:hypothetical protein
MYYKSHGDNKLHTNKQPRKSYKFFYLSASQQNHAMKKK